jgi:hypothetical protein
MIQARRGSFARCLSAPVLLAAALAGCGPADQPPARTGTPAPAVSSGPSASPAVTVSVPPGPGAGPSAAATADVQVDGTLPEQAAVLTAIRAAGQAGYDRVVLEFDRPFGGYSAGYVDSISRDPSGEPIQLQGKAFLRVILQGATTDNGFQAGADNPPAAYRGPLRATPMLPAVQEVAGAGDFEATLSFGIGVAARSGFRVQVLKAPARLVIDISHPAS